MQKSLQTGPSNSQYYPVQQFQIICRLIVKIYFFQIPVNVSEVNICDTSWDKLLLGWRVSATKGSVFCTFDAMHWLHISEVFHREKILSILT